MGDYADFLATVGLAAIAVALAALLFACASSPYSPEGAQLIAPTPEMREWYEAAAECRGIAGNFDAVVWYLVPDKEGTAKELGIEGAVGVWTPPHNIYFHACCWTDEPTVRHESLHDILSYRYGNGRENIDHADSLAFYGPDACDLTP